ncbi:hypothetical protein [Halalkalibacter hemicellulosilyticus]|uniref:Uncharacterized protein n=1 Tax=Halalkalibacter hemicellulosilyticusJCM 9152 TaxID=1236971 RepID=W4QEA4_9BACI|nr:hypothetical protein [Halalkalibacter hemicellulosilyticus]GAE30386.1 hypothetical protein JCM9152_1792 [Halalkalibacter hemicellulosilyticusJCM 9152]
MINVVIDFMFAIFPIHFVFEHILGIYELDEISEIERFSLFVTFSIVIYVAYRWQEGIFQSRKGMKR